MSNQITTQEKEPYHSIRVHISESTTQKMLGMKTRSIEITFGNQQTKKIIKSKDDVADIAETTISQELSKVWDEVTDMGKSKGWKFTEDYQE